MPILKRQKTGHLRLDFEFQHGGFFEASENEPDNKTRSKEEMEIPDTIVLPIVKRSEAQNALVRTVQKMRLLSNTPNAAIKTADTRAGILERLGTFWGMQEGKWHLVDTKQTEAIDSVTRVITKTFDYTYESYRIDLYLLLSNSDERLPAVTEHKKCIKITSMANGELVTGVEISKIIPTDSRANIATEEAWRALLDGIPKIKEERTIEDAINNAYRLELKEGDVADKKLLDTLNVEGAMGLWDLASQSERRGMLPRCVLDILMDTLEEVHPNYVSKLAAGALWALTPSAVCRKAMHEMGILKRLLVLVAVDPVAFDTSPKVRVLERCLGAIALFTVDAKSRRLIMNFEKETGLITKFASTPCVEKDGGDDNDDGDGVDLEGYEKVDTDERAEPLRQKIASKAFSNMLIREGTKAMWFMGKDALGSIATMSKSEDESVRDSAIMTIGSLAEDALTYAEHCTIEEACTMFFASQSETLKWVKVLQASNPRVSQHDASELEKTTKAMWASIAILQAKDGIQSVRGENIIGELLEMVQTLKNLRSSKCKTSETNVLHAVLSLSEKAELAEEMMSEECRELFNVLLDFLDTPTSDAVGISGEMSVVLAIICNVAEHSTKGLGGLEVANNRKLLLDCDVYAKVLRILLFCVKQDDVDLNETCDICSCIIMLLSNSIEVISEEDLRSIINAINVVKSVKSASHLSIAMWIFISRHPIREALMACARKLAPVEESAANTNMAEGDEAESGTDAPTGDEESTFADSSNDQPNGESNDDAPGEEKKEIVVDPYEEQRQQLRSEEMLLGMMNVIGRRWVAAIGSFEGGDFDDVCIFLRYWIASQWLLIVPRAPKQHVPSLVRARSGNILPSWVGIQIEDGTEDGSITQETQNLFGMLSILLLGGIKSAIYDKVRLLALGFLQSFYSHTFHPLDGMLTSELEKRLLESIGSLDEPKSIRMMSCRVILMSTLDERVIKTLMRCFSGMLGEDDLDLKLEAAKGISVMSSCVKNHNVSSLSTGTGVLGASWRFLVDCAKDWSKKKGTIKGFMYTNKANECLGQLSSALIAVHNLSVHRPNQVKMASYQGFVELSQLRASLCAEGVRRRDKKGTYTFTAGVLGALLSNIASNPNNRTAMYKAELKCTAAKIQKEKEKKMMKSPGHRARVRLQSLSPGKSEGVVDKPANKASQSNERFMKWMNETFPTEKLPMYSMPKTVKPASSADFQLHRMTEEEEWAEIEAMRVIGLQSKMSKPLRHQLGIPGGVSMSKIDNPWNPKIMNYREANSSLQLTEVASRLLVTERPSNTLASLSRVAEDISKHPDMELNNEEIKTSRPETPLQEHPLTLLETLRESSGEDANSPQVTFAIEEGGVDNSGLHGSPPTMPEAEAEAEATGLESPGDQKPVKLKVELEPMSTDAARGKSIKFGTNASMDSRAIYAQSLGSINSPKMAIWEHVEGSKVYQTLFPRYHLPNGRSAYFYYSPGPLADQIATEREPPLDFPLTMTMVEDIYQDSGMECEHFPAQLCLVPIKVHDPRNSVKGFCPAPILAPKPDILVEEDKEIPREVFVVEVVKLTRHEIDEEVREMEKEKEPWRIQNSIFKRRPRECDSRTFFNTTTTFSRQMKREWAILSGKNKFMTFLKREFMENSNEIINDVHQFVSKNWETLINVFQYYSATGGNDIFRLSWNSFTTFSDECQLIDPESKFCQKKDVDTLFIMGNFQEDKKLAASQKNMENALMPFEFIEVLVRLAVQKYVKVENGIGLIEAMEVLVKDKIKPHIPLHASTDPNDFRQEQLYCEELDNLLTSHEKFLTALYKRYFLRPQGGGPRYQRMVFDPGYMNMVQDLDLISDLLTLRDASMLFLNSRMVVMDYVKDWIKHTSLSFIDFLEVICRIADFLALPGQEEIAEQKFDTILDTYYALIAPEATKKAKRRDSAYVVKGPKTRGLCEKTAIFIDLLSRIIYKKEIGGDDYNYETVVKTLVKIDREMGS